VDPVLEIDGVTHAGITWFGCNGSGHYRNQCPAQDGVQMIQCFGSEEHLEATHEYEVEESDNAGIPPENEVYGEDLRGGETTHEDANEDNVFVDFSFFQKNKTIIIKSSLTFLDSESTMCDFCNKDLLKDVGPHKNGESVKFQRWYTDVVFGSRITHVEHACLVQQGLTGEYSLSGSVTKIYHVIIYTAQETVMHMHVSENNIMTFLRCQMGSTVMIRTYLIIVLIN